MTGAGPPRRPRRPPLLRGRRGLFELRVRSQHPPVVQRQHGRAQAGSAARERGRRLAKIGRDDGCERPQGEGRRQPLRAASTIARERLCRAASPIRARACTANDPITAPGHERSMTTADTPRPAPAPSTTGARKLALVRLAPRTCSSSVAKQQPSAHDERPAAGHRRPGRAGEQRGNQHAEQHGRAASAKQLVVEQLAARDRRGEEELHLGPAERPRLPTEGPQPDQQGHAPTAASAPAATMSARTVESQLREAVAGPAGAAHLVAERRTSTGTARPTTRPAR